MWFQVCRFAFSVLLSGIFLVNQSEARQIKIYTVNGEITKSDYKGFEQFLINSLDSVIGLKVYFLADSSDVQGELSVGANNGQFVAYINGDVAESEIVATEGFQFLHGDYVFDGFFIVKSGGMHQGIISLYLQKTDEAQVRLSAAKIIDVQAGRLNAKYQKKP